MQEQLMAIKNWLGQGSINIFGMPFAGKDTQGQTLSDLLEAELLGGGKILRNSSIPPHVRQIMNAGGLIPINDYLDIVLPYLSHQQFDGKPLILSSVGRWDGEQHGVMQAAEASNHPIKAVILLTVSKEVAKERQAKAAQDDRGLRADDDNNVFAARLQEYQVKTTPVIDFYRKKGLLLEVNGMHEPPRVTSDILQKLADFAGV